MHAWVQTRITFGHTFDDESTLSMQPAGSKSFYSQKCDIIKINTNTMRRSYLPVTRRGGMRLKHARVRWSHYHRYSQTERVWIHPRSSEVPMPHKLLDTAVKRKYTTTCDHVNRVLSTLGLVPLHYKPIPLEAWRLLIQFSKCDLSFSHFIIPQFADKGGVLLTVSGT